MDIKLLLHYLTYDLKIIKLINLLYNKYTSKLN
jgi:hypothetical protein